MVHGSLLIIPLTLGVMFVVEGPDCIMNNILLFCGAHMWRVTSWIGKLYWHARIFPECVARVPVSLWGSGGSGCVRSTLRFCSLPSTWGPYGRACGKFCRGGHFWRFQRSRCFASRGRRGTSWHSDVFCNVSKAVLCGRRFCDIFRRCVAVFVAGAALWTCSLSFFVAGAAL